MKHVSDGMQLRFLDSFRFTSVSLGKLTANLPTEKCFYSNAHINTSISYSVNDEWSLSLLREHVSCFSKLEEIWFPPREAFHSSISKTTLHRLNTGHTQMIWTAIVSSKTLERSVIKFIRSI